MGKQNKIKVLTYNINSVKINYKLKLRGLNMKEKMIEYFMGADLQEQKQKKKL